MTPLSFPDGRVLFEIGLRLIKLIQALYGGDWKDQEAQHSSWSTHNSGDIALTSANPPSFFATGPAHRLFVDGRLNHVLDFTGRFGAVLTCGQAQYAIAARKKLIYTEPAWMTDPWSHHTKTRKDLLVDVLLEIPSLYEALDNMNLQPDKMTKLKHRRNLQTMVSVVMKRLHLWKLRHAVTVACSEPDWRFPSSIATGTIADAHVMTLYWASCIHTYHIYRIVSDGECEVVEFDPDDCCCNIIHCVPLFLHPSTGIFRQHLIPYPLITAARHLRFVQSPELQVERDFLQSLREKPEFSAMFQFMSSLQSKHSTF